MNPHLSHCYVILVHYGDPAVTTAALAALVSGTRVPDRIIIVDHAIEVFSAPASPISRVVRPALNSGYAAGLNIGLGLIFTDKPKGHDIVVCMNNDVVVAPHSLEELMKSAAGDSQPHLLGAEWGVINPFTGRANLLPEKSAPPRLKSLAYIDGAFFAAPWSVFQQIKKIPDDYFLYWEEAALQAELRQHGIMSRIIPKLDIRHAQGKSSTPSSTHTYYLIRNGAHYLQTKAPWPVRLWWRFYNRIRYVYHTFRGPRARLEQAALADALAGKLGQATLPKKML